MIQAKKPHTEKWNYSPAWYGKCETATAGFPGYLDDGGQRVEAVLLEVGGLALHQTLHDVLDVGVVPPLPEHVGGCHPILGDVD